MGVDTVGAGSFATVVRSPAANQGEEHRNANDRNTNLHGDLLPAPTANGHRAGCPLAVIAQTETVIGPPEHDRSNLVDASVSANTRRVYASFALPPRRVARRAPAR